MKVVSFVENREVLLCQLMNTEPTKGQSLRIKGRNATVDEVEATGPNSLTAKVTREALIKAKASLDNSKKKKK